MHMCVHVPQLNSRSRSSLTRPQPDPHDPQAPEGGSTQGRVMGAAGLVVHGPGEQESVRPPWPRADEHGRDKGGG